jgi:hypothetical protein
MNPKGLMQRVCLVCMASVLLSGLTGDTRACEIPTGVICAAAVILFCFYRRMLRRGEQKGRQAPQHRLESDRTVMAQWLGIGLVGTLACLFGKTTPLGPHPTGQLFDVLKVGIAIWSTALFVSMLIDWYSILPKLGGFTGPAPCESPGPEWRDTTQLWYLHRSALTAVLYATAIGGAAYLADTISSPSLKAIYIAVGGSVAVVAGYVYRELPRAAIFGLNAPIFIGGQLYLYGESDSPLDGESRKVRRRGYVVDVSLQGVKCKALTNGYYDGPKFDAKDDQTVANEDLFGLKVPPRQVKAQCPNGACTGVNWYCQWNLKAYD